MTRLKPGTPKFRGRRMAAIGNVLRHEYEHVAHDVIRHVMQDDLPALAKVCREELARERAADG